VYNNEEASFVNGLVVALIKAGLNVGLVNLDILTAYGAQRRLLEDFREDNWKEVRVMTANSVRERETHAVIVTTARTAEVVAADKSTQDIGFMSKRDRMSILTSTAHDAILPWGIIDSFKTTPTGKNIWDISKSH